MFGVRIDNSAMGRYAAVLQQLHKSALPVAVRQTLNSAAYDVKTKTMPTTAKKTFTQRKPSFFKANSRVEVAKGFDIGTMKATVGFVKRASNGVDKAVAELEQQEHGGKIKRPFVALDSARVSKNRSKMVRPVNRWGNVGNIVNAEKVKGNRSAKQRYMRAAIMAAKLFGNDAYVLGNRYRGQQTLSRIDGIDWYSNRGGSGRIARIRRTPIYQYRRGRWVNIKRTKFMERASKESGMSMPNFYEQHAMRQIKKYMNKV